jgi:hypothetical protein
MVLEKVGIKSTNRNEAIDGLRSTWAEIPAGFTLDIQTNYKYKNIGGIGLKFKGGPFKFSVNGKEFTSKIADDEVQQFKFTKVETDNVSIKALDGNIQVRTAEVYTDGAAKRSAAPFTCIVVPTGTVGRRWQCTSGDQTKTWLAGSDYRYKGLLAYQAPFDNNTPPVLTPTPSPQPEPPSPAPSGDGTVKGPYPLAGKEYSSTTRGPTTRNYASGKASDETIEKNIKGIKTRNHQFIVYTTIKKMEHDDNISLKGGGTHMGTGWFDHSLEIYTGKTGLGYEPDHPETHLFVKKGPTLGDIRNKKVGVAMTYFADENYTELWVDKDANGKWVKVVEGKDIGGFNPKAKEFEYQERIDGFEKDSVPILHSAIAQDIAPRKNP